MTNRTRRFIIAVGLPLLGGALYACGSSSENGTPAGTKSGGGCKKDADCASASCVSGTCAAGSGLSDGKSCSAASECASGVCTSGVCGAGAEAAGGGANGGAGSGAGGTSGNAGGTSNSDAGGSGTTGGKPVGGTCTASAECASGLCAKGACATPTGSPGSGPVTTGPHWTGSGTGFRPLTAGCGPSTANECTGTCEQAGGDPNVKIIRPPATLCFSGNGDPTPDDPAVVIEQSIETLNGVSYVHLRITFDPRFVDNTFGTGAIGWNPRRPHTFVQDLTKSDHTELLLTNATGATVSNFKLDYVSADPSQSCGFGSLGAAGGDGSVITGDPSKILAISTSVSRNLNGCGYCQNAACDGGDCTVNSPKTDADFTPNPGTPNWDYRVAYEVWIDVSAFGTSGFGQAYMTYVHASPSKANSDTVHVLPIPCPPKWDVPYCPPGATGSCFGNGTGGGGGVGGGAGAGGAIGAGGSGGMVPRGCPVNYQIYITSEGASTCTPIPFVNYPGMTPCPAGYVLDVLSEGRYCLPKP